MENKDVGQLKRCVQQKRYLYCGRYLKPDNRVGERQKCCKEKTCQANWKKDSQKGWLEANPGYFKGRYEYVKQWWKEHPDYQCRWRAKRREIQDEIRLVKQCGCGFFVAGRGMQDTRLD